MGGLGVSVLWPRAGIWGLRHPARPACGKRASIALSSGNGTSEVLGHPQAALGTRAPMLVPSPHV